MANWDNIPDDPLKYQFYQDQFWRARRARLCESCAVEFETPPHNSCPKCKRPGLRKNHRLILLAGRRGGKTRAGAIAGAEEATVPNTVGWACAPTNPKLNTYVIPAFKKLIPSDWVADYSSEYKDLRLKNGSLIHFQTLEDPNQGRGPGLDWLWIDEVCELTSSHWEVIRPALTEKRGVAFFTTSPHSYDWVWKEFYKRAEDGYPGYWAARYKTADNPIITADELAEARDTMTDAMFRQEYEADFVIFEGAVYGGLIEQQILRGNSMVQKVIPEWPRVDNWRQLLVGIDTGAEHPFGAVKIVATEKGLVVIGEYLEKNKSFQEHAVNLKRLANASNVKYAINKNDKQPSIELAQHGIYCQKAENEVVAGTERVKTWLAARQLWFVEEKCPRTVAQMSAYRWAKPKTTDGQLRLKETPFKVDDDLPDALRYALMTWPVLPTAPPKEEEKPRDLGGMSEAAQLSIRRVRRIEEKLATPPPTDVTGDFWL